MKRRAMDIIMATSCTGTPTFFRNPRPFSRPSVSSLGVVVKVMTEEPSTRKIRRSAINTAVRRPSQVIFRNPSCTMASPGVRNRLKLTLISRRTSTAFRPRTINLNGTFDSFITAARNRAATPYPRKLSVQNREMINSSVPNSFVRGSMRCSTESTG